MKTERQQDQDVAERLRRENLERASATKDNEVDEKAENWDYCRDLRIAVTDGKNGARATLNGYGAPAGISLYHGDYVAELKTEAAASAATVAELRARADALAEELRHANKGYVHELNRATALEADAARYRFLRRKLCVTGNGDGTCAMQAINLPHRIHGWPEHGEHEQFFDAAIDSYLTGADPT